MTCILIIAVFTGVYTIVGGLRAVVWTEILQICVLLLGMVALSVATIKAAGGISALMETSKDWKIFLPATDKDFPWTQYLGGTLCISIFYFATNQFIVQRTLAAKNEWHARMGVIFAQYLKFLTPFLIIAPALVAVKLFPNLEKPDLLFVNLVEHLLPSGLIGLLMAALMSGVMSHLSGAINSGTTIMTIDIYLPYINKNATDSESVRFGRIAGIVIILLGIVSTVLLINYSDKPVFLYLMNAYGLFTPGIAAMFLLGILWKRTTQAGALAAGILTIPMSIVFEILYPDMPFLNRTGIVFWSCMALCVIVSLLTKPKPAAELEGLVWSRESLLLPQEQRGQQKGLRNPFIWWAIITAAVLFFYIKYA
jgi:SSS family solute:Na+ symporter